VPLVAQQSLVAQEEKPRALRAERKMDFMMVYE
jgi:hypothetical protein